MVTGLHQAKRVARKLRAKGKRLARHARRQAFQIALAAAPWDAFAKGVVFFDMDDTLLDHEHAFLRFSRDLYQASCIHQAHTEEEAVALMTSFADIISQWPGVFKDTDEATQVYQAKLPHMLTLDDSTRGLLEDLKSQGVPCAIVTNGGASSQMKKVRASGLDKLVQAIVISGQLGIRKPDRRIFMQGLAEMSADPTSAIFVGDNPDEENVGAKSVGMRTVWLDRGREWPYEDQPPDHIVAHVSEVRDLVLGQQ